MRSAALLIWLSVGVMAGGMSMIALDHFFPIPAKPEQLVRVPFPAH